MIAWWCRFSLRGPSTSPGNRRGPRVRRNQQRAPAIWGDRRPPRHRSTEGTNMTHETVNTEGPQGAGNPGNWGLHPTVAKSLWMLTEAQASAYAAEYEASVLLRNEESQGVFSRHKARMIEVLTALTGSPEADTGSLRTVILGALGDDPGPRPWALTVGRSGRYLGCFEQDEVRKRRLHAAQDAKAKRSPTGAVCWHFVEDDPRAAHLWMRLCKIPGLAMAARDAGALVVGVDRHTGYSAMVLAPDWHPLGPITDKSEHRAKPVAPLAVSEGGVVVSAGLALVGATVTDPALRAAGLVERSRGSASRAVGGKRQGAVEGAPPGWNVWVLPEGEGAHPVDVLVATPAGVAYFEQHGGIVAWVKARKEASRLPQDAPLKPIGASADERAADRAKTRAVHAEIRALAGKGRRAKR